MTKIQNLIFFFFFVYGEFLSCFFFVYGEFLSFFFFEGVSDFLTKKSKSEKKNLGGRGREVGVGRLRVKVSIF